MKNTIILLTLLYFIQNVLGGGDEILAKFHQKSYKVKDLRVQLINYNKSYYHNFDISTFKYNRTTPANNLTFSSKVEFREQLEILIQAYKFLSNEYRHFPLRFQVNLQKAFRANVAGLKNVIRCGNITTCDFHKDITYHACNFVIDEAFLPPLVPNGQYKLAVYFLYLNHNIAEAAIFCEIYTPIPIPKK